MTWTLAPLARAPAETLNVNALLILVSAGVVGAAAALAGALVVLVNRRRHRHRELIVGLAVLWALASAGSVIAAVNRDWSASAERQRLVEQGDLDPREPAVDPPAWTPLWAGLATAYAGLSVWAARGRSAVP